MDKKKALLAIVDWTWCLPQNLIGFGIKLCTKAEKKDGYYKFNIRCGSVSLGKYIFLCPSHWFDLKTLKHEQGHTKQSYILGWLYLPVIALPSLIWAGCFGRYRKKHKISYYDFYTEKWANKLSGIDY